MARITAVIFNLDGVLVTTEDCHFMAWKQMADEQGIPFDRGVNERLRGKGRMESLDIILDKARRPYTEGEKMALAMRKNDLYIERVLALDESAALPGAITTLKRIKDAGIPMAIGSSSKNAKLILRQMKLEDYFSAVADGNMTEKSKPDPEVFLLAAKKLNVPPCECLVIEDADDGIEAAALGGMTAFGIGSAKAHQKAARGAETLAQVDLAQMILNGDFNKP